MAEDSKSSDASDSSSESANEPIKPQKPIPKPLIQGKITKKRKNIISVCLTNCRYEVIRKIAAKFAYKEVSENENWNLYWTDLSITVERCKEMKRYQKINHFPGMLEICRKDLLARNLNRMLRLFPKEYNFFPRTWCLPADLGEALTYSRLRRNRTFILKPDAGSQGRGIFVTKSLKDIRPCDRGVCQVYINKPYLIDGYKFDLRIYTLITSCDPLRIYIYEEGLVRFATTRYKEPNAVNISNVFMHLTNYAVNKYSRTYNQDTEAGSKRKLSWFNNYLRKLGHDVEGIWKRIDDVIIKTVISAAPVLKHSYAACFPNHDVIPACSELLGVDIILDKRLNPQILEVNHSPSFHTDTALDWEIKEALLSDMFAMMNLDKCDKRKVMREDRKRIRERLLHGKDHQPPVVVSFDDYYRLEMNSRGGFRFVYPTQTTKVHYNKFFDQGQGSLYSETAASRAREAAQNALRDEMQLKARLEAAKRVVVPPIKPPAPKKLETPNQNKPTSKSTAALSVMSSSEPQMIVESEERDRLQRLAQREYLIRSHGILEHVYFSMKKNGNLRPRDEKKFAIFDKIRATNENNFNKQNGIAISDLVESIKAKSSI
ncbi:tubulin polyglutamylase ttll6-like [Tribolium madens]|uniref:tubulin polyglutamylase ttll6-like n=1 Tax=Tribolium madens TaxID=41895 RepID=UPI001CF72907|nr:tubulin polyglutamylase ttll6-like [Tribolium madens]